MGLSHEHVGPKILAKIQIYILTRAELLFTLCSKTSLEGHNTVLFRIIFKSQKQEPSNLYYCKVGPV